MNTKTQPLVARQWAFLQNLSRLIAWAAAQGMVLTGGELFRPALLQQHYLAQGKTRVRHSRHQRRLAADLNLFVGGVYQTDTEAYRPLGAYWCALHPDNRWGGDWNRNGQTADESFPDGNHFEMGG